MMPDLFGWLLDRPPRRRADRRLDDPAPRPPDRHLVRRALPGPRPAPRDPARADRAGDRARAAAQVGRGRGRDGAARDGDRAGHARHGQRRGRRAGVGRDSCHPSAPPDWCYLSSGTWSLLGVEVPRPVINAETLRYNFTNEGGVAGTTRLLKNIMGLWLVQECRRTWAAPGGN